MKAIAFYRVVMVLALAATLLITARPVQAEPLSYWVNSSGDGSDINQGNNVCETGPGNGVCTLRAAIQEANARAGIQWISFSADYTLTPATPYPTLSDTSGGTRIYSSGRTIIVDGATTSGTTKSGFFISSDYNSIEGIVVKNFYVGILVEGNNNHITGCTVISNTNVGIDLEGMTNHVAASYIGTDASDTTGVGNTLYGVLVLGTNNMVGTDGDGVSDDTEKNVISGNVKDGVYITEGGGHVVAGNYIGTTKNGISALPNGECGVQVEGAPEAGIRIGTNGNGVSDGYERNIISGNTKSGICIDDGTGIVVAGNFIGTTYDGTTDLGNMEFGVVVGVGASGIIIGTNGDGSCDHMEKNLISGNSMTGVVLSSADNVVAGNLIGVNWAGDTAIQNEYFGVWIEGANNRIGTDGNGVSDDYERNIISGNKHFGIHVLGSSSVGNIIAGNYIGTDIDGNTAIPNVGAGIALQHSSGTRIGTNGDGNGDAAEWNIISGNTSNGIWLSGSSLDIIAGNYIGTNAVGDPLGNGGAGIYFEDALKSKITYKTNITSSVIAYNTGDGIYVDTAAGEGHNFSQNSIYSNGGLGIDLGPNGVTMNDGMDADSGANGLQNFPALYSARFVTTDTVKIGGALNSLPEHEFRVEFYASDTCNASGYGEGKYYLTNSIVVTDINGNVDVSRSVSIPSALSGGEVYLTVLARDTATGNTSEFSNCIEAQFVVFMPLVKN
jgi:CSLREA domain-containing protein